MRFPALILSLLLCRALSSQNNLMLYSAHGELFTVTVNDTQINKTPQASVLVQHIADDTLDVKIGSANASFPVRVYLLDKGRKVSQFEFSYRLEFKSGGAAAVFSGAAPIHPLRQPIVPAKPVIDTSGKYRNNVLGNYCELKDSKPTFFNNLPQGDCTEPMPAAYMNYFAILMKKAHVNADRYSIAENTLRNNCVSTIQLNRILSWMPYEIEKLKLVRIGWFQVCDKQNKQNLDSAFKLESSRKELHNFLKEASDHKYKKGDCSSPSSTDALQSLYARLRSAGNDTERLSVLKKSYSDYCYTTADIKTILTIFYHDREKLESAKLLYFYCTDKEKYATMADAFSYTTSFADLLNFVNKQNHR